MSKNLYKCENDHLFEAEDEYGECPECGITQYTKVSNSIFSADGILNWFKENKFLSAVIFGVVFLLIIISQQGGPSEPPSTKYEVDFEQPKGENFIVCNITKYEVDKKGNRNVGLINFMAYPKEFEEFSKSFSFQLEGEVPIEFDGNKFYPCQSSEITIIWENSSTYQLKKSSNTTKTLRFILPDNGANALAECLPNLDIKVSPISGCKLKLSSNLDGNKDYEIYYSISGEKGNFLTKNTYSLDELLPYKYNVFGYIKSLKTEKISGKYSFINNGDLCKPIDCEECSKDSIEKTVKILSRIINSWGINIGNQTEQDKLMHEFKNNSCIDDNIIIFIDGYSYNYDSFLNETFKMFINDDEIKFNSNPNGIKYEKSGSRYRISKINIESFK